MFYCEICDNGFQEWAVFVHGMGGSILTWKRQIEDFSKNYNLLLVDLPGHGKVNEQNLKEKEITNVDDELKNVLDANNIKKANFIGMSLGTIIIAKFAIKYPQYISSIIFGGASIKLEGAYKTLVNVTEAIKWVFPKKFMCRLFAFILMPRKNHKISRQIFVREAFKMQRKNLLLWVSYLTIAIRPNILISKLNNTKINILFISGDEDHCFLKGAKNAANSIQAATVKIIKHCGHVCSIERYKEFNDEALKYLLLMHNNNCCVC